MKRFGANLKYLRKERGLSQAELADLVGVLPTTISNYETGASKPDFDTLLKISKILDVTLDALTGEDMSKTSRQTKVMTPQRQSLPLYDLQVTAGNVPVFKEDVEKISFYVNIPLFFQDCDFFVQVAGHSMYPKIKSGNLIACKKLTNLQVIPYGEMYLVVTDEQRMVKRIRKSDKAGYLLLTSDNPEYEPFEIDRKDILHLYQIKGIIEQTLI